MSIELYKSILLDHARNPRNRGDADRFRYRQRGRIPQCGDDLTVGLDVANGQVADIGFGGRGCIISMASASLMTETLSGATIDSVRLMLTQVKGYFNALATENELPKQLLALAPVQNHTARRRCVLLAWEALQKALDQQGAEKNDAQQNLRLSKIKTCATNPSDFLPPPLTD